MSTTRRSLLQASIVLATVGEVVAAGASFDPLAPNSLHQLYRRIRFGADGQAVYWWLRGTRYGLVDNVLMPFFDMHVGSIHRRRDFDADRYEISSASAIYYTAVGGDALLERWENPVTGRTVRFEYAAPRIGITSYSLTRGQLVASELPGLRAVPQHSLGPARRDAGRIWLDEASHVQVDRGSAPAMKVHDLYTYSVAEADLTSTGGLTPAIAAFNDFNDWSPRFEMGDHPGSSISRCAGSKVAELSAMPARWRGLFDSLHPQGFAALRSAAD